jgi:hypothetical protein
MVPRAKVLMRGFSFGEVELLPLVAALSSTMFLAHEASFSARVGGRQQVTTTCPAHEHNVSEDAVSAHNMPRPVFHCQCADHAWSALTRGHITLVSPEDSHLLEGRAWSAHDCKDGTVYARANKLLHRVISDGKDVDHRNRNGCDNRRSNLRPCTLQQNMANRRRFKHSSGFKGVVRRGDRWLARITVDSKNVYLGTHSSEETAARAYDNAARQHFGEFAQLNFPQT